MILARSSQLLGQIFGHGASVAKDRDCRAKKSVSPEEVKESKHLVGAALPNNPLTAINEKSFCPN
jgi:2-keto-4-pentenoate hydratase